MPAGCGRAMSAVTACSALSAGIEPKAGTQGALPPEERSVKPVSRKAAEVTYSNWQPVRATLVLTVPLRVAAVSVTPVACQVCTVGSGGQRLRRAPGEQGAADQRREGGELAACGSSWRSSCGPPVVLGGSVLALALLGDAAGSAVARDLALASRAATLRSVVSGCPGPGRRRCRRRARSPAALPAPRQASPSQAGGAGGGSGKPPFDAGGVDVGAEVAVPADQALAGLEEDSLAGGGGAHQDEGLGAGAAGDQAEPAVLPEVDVLAGVGVCRTLAEDDRATGLAVGVLGHERVGRREVRRAGRRR